MFWKEDIEVSLTISGSFRVGSGKAGLEVDLPVVKEYLNNGKISYYSSNFSSSLRGILRKSVRRMIQSTDMSALANLEEDLFGTWVTEPGRRKKEGKIQIKLTLPPSEGVKQYSRTGIRIDEVFGSVAHQALFTYEVLECEEKKLTLKFKLTSDFPLSEDDAALLLAGLNGLTYDFIGGFASRGLGLIEKVEVDQKFKDFAKQHLEKYLEK
ncbi:MAG: RAMP superfamily CRISPR-associated protein [Candidatus Jordarchaeum sp.]|uniref:RAMP superfamily CRISPR-associated protein n=1 Tax=Candidatus Jordarchaeum sp. TaxID=2823881 RepID=UPI00404B6753